MQVHIKPTIGNPKISLNANFMLSGFFKLFLIFKKEFRLIKIESSDVGVF